MTARIPRYVGALLATALFLLSVALDPQASLAANPSCSPTETTYGSYTSQAFTATGTCDWVVPANAATVDVLIVAGGGGGGGGAFAGGGGAGGLVQKTGMTLTTGSTMEIVVGAGGAGGAANISGSPVPHGTNGGNSSFNSYIATGGGGGAGYWTFGATPRTNATGLDGGSGGGGSEGSSAGGSATQASYSGSGFGNAGAYSSNLSGTSGGGGGGAAGAGSNGASSSGGAGGAGKVSIYRNGTSVAYAAGGRGGSGTSNTNGTAGAANTGNGGGGASFSTVATLGGAGGSGIVIIRWAAAVSPPGTPGQPSAVAGDGQATITVVAPGSGGTPTSYLVTSNPDGKECTVTGASGSCDVTGLTNGVSYTFTVTASNDGGTSSSSPASASVTPVITAPGTPGQPTVAAGDGEATVTISAPNTGGAPESYLVTSNPDGKECTVTVPDTLCTITGLTNGVAYTFTSTATNAGGTSGSSSASNSVTPVITAPGVPGAPTAISGNAQATITISAPTTGGAPATYLVTSNPEGKECTVTAPDTSCVILGLTNGVSYTFTSTATNAGGTSASSVESNEITPSSVPAPAIASVTLQGIVGQSVTGVTVEISGSGLQTGANYNLVLRSTPQNLLHGTVVGGSVNERAVIPAGLEAGWHSLTFNATTASGYPIVTTMYFNISSSGILLETSQFAPELPETGVTLAPYLSISALLILIGASAVVARVVSRRQRQL